MNINILFFSLKMFEEEDYKMEVLMILNNPSRKVMSGLRMELFIAAATSSNAENALMPFPSCFFDPVQKVKRFEDLRTHLQAIPPLKKLLDDINADIPDNLPPITWRLLYWILTNPLTIQPVEMNFETMGKWEQETGLSLSSLRSKSLRAFLFQVVNPNPKPEFVKGKEEFGTVFAFHGSKLDNFHSIVHRGLLSALNVRKAYGHGSYLSTQLNVSMGYTDQNWRESWGNGDFGRYLRCVAICEIVKYPELKSHSLIVSAQGPDQPKPNVYVVDKDEFVQLSHLILFVASGFMAGGFGY